MFDRFGVPGQLCMAAACRVVVDNETREDCTLVKVDSVNRDGVLLEMVQLLTDLDLVISKSYISIRRTKGSFPTYRLKLAWK
ncbi:hypothetical protein GUJ93_ZPchr0172g2973 [Zizania palustris]|uniref:ACT domain-containing protein ACR n=1 Tax=Zizania palustris TaxID=103762 RepID=A0A8J5SU50_ZIZPA|nr:hypothetical protein GUJ93_ZPchr0172g2973 [Zizania palustris]